MSKLVSVDLRHTRIDDAFWNKYTELVWKEVLPYQWRALNDAVTDAEPSHAIHNFRIAAGEVEGEFMGWPFQDSDLHKWLEAVAYVLTWHPDPALEARADEAIELIGRAQKPDGYVDTYWQIRYPGQEFTNLREGHELYTMGHMIEAGVAYYHATGKTRYLDICRRAADHIVDVFHKPPLERGIPGHEEIELSLVKLYEATGEKPYLTMAADFINRRGENPPYFFEEAKRPGWVQIFSDQEGNDYHLDYAQTDRPVREQRQAEGHAVRAVYLYCAMADVAAYTGDETLLAACKTLYNNIVNCQMYVTGGIGSSGMLERFTKDYDLPNASNYAESCASVGLALFSRRMAKITHDARYMDTAELALSNTVTSGIAMDGKSFFYVNPLALWPAAGIPGTDRQHVKPVRQPWFGCACCPPNIARTLASLGEYVYFTGKDDAADDPASTGKDTVYVNLFVSSTTHVTLGGADYAVSLSTKYPFEDTVDVQIMRCAETETDKDAARKINETGTAIPDSDHAAADTAGDVQMAIRIPSCVRSFATCGTTLHYTERNGYLYFEGPFESEKFTLELDMPAQFIHADPRVRYDEGCVAVKKGPLVYCLESVDNGENLNQFLVDTSAPLSESFDSDLLGGTLVITAEGWRQTVSGMPGGALYGTGRTVLTPATLKFIPYAYWDNRTDDPASGEMQVWVRERV